MSGLHVHVVTSGVWKQLNWGKTKSIFALVNLDCGRERDFLTQNFLSIFQSADRYCWLLRTVDDGGH